MIFLLIRHTSDCDNGFCTLVKGVRRAYSKVVQIGETCEIVDETILIKDDYEASNGTANDAAPK